MIYKDNIIIQVFVNFYILDRLLKKYNLPCFNDVITFQIP